MGACFVGAIVLVLRSLRLVEETWWQVAGEYAAVTYEQTRFATLACLERVGHTHVRVSGARQPRRQHNIERQLEVELSSEQVPSMWIISSRRRARSNTGMYSIVAPSTLNYGLYFNLRTETITAKRIQGGES